MKSAIIATTLLSSLALSKPLAKREQRTIETVETATVTVTGGADGGWGGPVNHWGSWSWSPPTDEASPETPATTTTAAAAVATTSAAPKPEVQQAAPVEQQAAPVEQQAAPVQHQQQQQEETSPAKSWGQHGSDSGSGSAPAPAAPVSSGSGTSTSSNTAGLSEYAAPIVEQHNIHRANHSSPALEWDDDLAAIAAQIAATCRYEHNTEMGGGGYGQNIGAGAPGTDVPKMITNQMYNGEIGLYNAYGGEPVMEEYHQWGHASQIVWASTTKLGCATQKCDGGLANTGSGISPYFTVCNYKPAGNYKGQFSKNVMAPQGNPTVTV